jgi:methanogenic corrinoid protein MtbC1
VLSTLREKLDEVRVISMKNPELLTKEHKNAMDYFQSLLSDEEIKMFQEMTKFTKGEAKNFKSVFSDHEKVMEGIVGMKTVNGTEFSAKLLYPNALTHGTKEVFSPEFSSEAEDLKSFYESMIKHEAYGDLEDNLTILHRRDIEESLY